MAANGFVAADEEAVDLLEAAAGDPGRLDAMIARRLTGEPLAWITGFADFCGLRLRVDPGVYVPRWQSEPLAERAAERLPDDGTAIDLCTGCGAIAKVLMTRRPGARVVATEVDERAVACARANGVDAHAGDLFAPVLRPAPEGASRDDSVRYSRSESSLDGEGRVVLAGAVDVVVGVVPYVPTPELHLLQRDTFTFESRVPYDGGPDGLAIVRRVVIESAHVLKSGGALLLELGGEQAEAVAPDLEVAGFTGVQVLRDEDGDVRGVEAQRC